MKRKILLLCTLALFFTFASCTKEDERDAQTAENTEQEAYDPPAVLPEGFFEVRFKTPSSNITKAPVTGADTRIQYLRYIIYKTTGEFVKEKTVWIPSQGTAIFPMPTIKDTLPNGNYKVVFLGNAERTLFPFASNSYADVLVNYKTNYSNARIVLPNAEFSNNSEYYWANTTFSNLSPNPSVLLQRIIGSAYLHRNFVDAQEALDTLVHNIATLNGTHNLIQNSVQTQLNGLLGPLAIPLNLILAPTGVVLNQVIGALVVPVTDTLYKLLLKDITNQVGMALTGNANQAGALAGLGALLNPWQGDSASAAIVTINNFPKSVDFDLNVIERFPNGTRFKYNFTSYNTYAEKDIAIKGFAGQWDVQKINVVSSGLVSGVLVNGVIDTWLLNGTLVDINDPLSLTVPANRRYKDNYSFLDLKVSPTATNRSVNVGIQLNQVANLNGALANLGLVGSVVTNLLNTILGAVGTTNIAVSGLQVPIVNNTNLVLTGSWDTPVAY